jgi:hypothetical protein
VALNINTRKRLYGFTKTKKGYEEEKDFITIR